ncbi:MAG: hypothetical protein AAF224_03950 [Pseudomonadota bacterium]
MTQFIGIVCGLKSEAAAVRAATDASTRQKLQIGVSGADAARAERIAMDFADAGAAAILSIGVSGGLDPSLAPGAFVLAHVVKTDDGDIHNPAQLVTASEIVRPIYGASKIIQTADEKSRIFARTGAVAVDMESAGAAAAALRAGVPFLAARAIADPASAALPPAAMNAVAPDGSTKVLATLGKCILAPAQFPALMELGGYSAIATKTLRNRLGGLFADLFLRLDL